VPYTSLTMYLTTNQSERDKATGLRMIFEVIGVLLGVVIQGVIISLFNINFKCPDDLDALPILDKKNNLVCLNIYKF
jgi:hypothetical protein